MNPDTQWLSERVEHGKAHTFLAGKVSSNALAVLGEALAERLPGHIALVIVSLRPEQTESGLYIPENVSRKEAAGWIISTGPCFGLNDPGVHGQHPLFDAPQDLLGSRVTYSAANYDNMIFTDRDRLYSSDFIRLRDTAVWSYNPGDRIPI